MDTQFPVWPSLVQQLRFALLSAAAGAGTGDGAASVGYWKWNGSAKGNASGDCLLTRFSYFSSPGNNNSNDLIIIRRRRRRRKTVNLFSDQVNARLFQNRKDTTPRPPKTSVKLITVRQMSR